MVWKDTFLLQVPCPPGVEIEKMYLTTHCVCFYWGSTGLLSFIHRLGRELCTGTFGQVTLIVLACSVALADR